MISVSSSWSPGRLATSTTEAAAYWPSCPLWNLTHEDSGQQQPDISQRAVFLCERQLNGTPFVDEQVSG
jgi:hypothetical protein